MTTTSTIEPAIKMMPVPEEKLMETISSKTEYKTYQDKKQESISIKANVLGQSFRSNVNAIKKIIM
jgi:hypothetical protein